ncbi:RDD family protein [Cohnella terricola]|uniref:RDD family protein n=1 Tax=Cohnella terricola TaxID=1289167 RepID=A0A559JIW8_9BACL|nr:RDD family protein [Cohnella terricola]TVX99812.1 RDD family protein [Cohnella terricola]
MSIPLEKEVSIVTPEQVQLEFPTAGVGMRAIAQLIDMLILGAFNLAVIIAIVLIGNEYAMAVLAIIGVVGMVGYYICCEYWMGGQTIGKRMVNIRVVQTDGRNAGLLAVVIRNLFRLIDILPVFYFLGMIVVMSSPRDRRIGDMVAGTIVVVEKEKERLKLRRKIDKRVDWMRVSLPRQELDEESRKAIAYSDWVLLAAWAERLPFVSPERLAYLGRPIAQHFAGKIVVAKEIAPNDTVFLIWLYEQLRGDWEV